MKSEDERGKIKERNKKNTSLLSVQFIKQTK